MTDFGPTTEQRQIAATWPIAIRWVLVILGTSILGASAFTSLRAGRSNQPLTVTNALNQPSATTDIRLTDICRKTYYSLAEALREPDRVCNLFLPNQGLIRLPPEIGTLSNLVDLELRNNQLTELPAEIGKLSNLSSLNLSHNRLSRLPPEIGRLHNLTGLYLEQNEIAALPPEIGTLQNLRDLRVSANYHLSDLPAEIGQLTNLRELLIDHNKIQHLPSTIGRLEKLEVLDAEGNNLTELPDEVIDLHHLRTLGLAGNPLCVVSSKGGGGELDDSLATSEAIKVYAPKSVRCYPLHLDFAQ